jgi:hypothetical protein
VILLDGKPRNCFHVHASVKDTQLIAKFAWVFPILGETGAIASSSDESWLASLYAQLPARFPPLYEQLILSYRWEDEVELGRLRLLPNPRSPDFSGLAAGIFRDKGLVESLIPGGFVQFGQAPDMNYDPVCFDLRGRRRKDGDYRIVQLDHEAILCHYKIQEVAELAPSFRELMLQIVGDAEKKRPE